MAVGGSEAADSSAKKGARTSPFALPKELPAAARMPLSMLVNIGVASR